MSRRLAIAIGFLAAFVLTFAAVPDAPAQIALPDEPSRIVSVGGAVTEIVYALGFGDRVVAVDTTSVYPPAADARPKVGYMRQLAAEPILALAPALVLAEQDSGPPAVLDQLRAAGARVTLISDDYSPYGIIKKIEAVGAALGVPERAQALAGNIRREIDAALAAVAQGKSQPRVLFLLSVGGATPLAAGRETSADGMITLAGGVNAIDGYEGYKPLSAEAAVAAAPDIVLVTERSLAQLGGIDSIATIPEISATPAGRARRIVAMDGLLMLGFGPRTPVAVTTLAARFQRAGMATKQP